MAEVSRQKNQTRRKQNYKKKEWNSRFLIIIYIIDKIREDKHYEIFLF